LRAELHKTAESYQKLSSENIQNESVANNLKRKITELKDKIQKDSEKMKTIELRIDRNLPYVKFEGRNFKIDKISHDCSCHI